MIKQIQLRGISRTPSDRLSEDGGLSESLNMFMDTAENAPAFVPEDVTKDLKLPADLQAERIFIHKTANYENYVVVLADKVVAYTPQIEDEEPITIMDLANGEEVSDIASIGNTVVIYTPESTHYALYRNNRYYYLGDRIPFPKVSLGGENEIGSKTIEIDTDQLGIYGMYRAFDKSTYNQYDALGNNSDANVQKILSELELQKRALSGELGQQGIFWGPIYAMYGITLYDGSVITTTPQIVGREYSLMPERTWSLWLSSTYQLNGLNKEFVGGIKANLNVSAFCLSVKGKEDYDIKEWGDIISSVDVYISTSIDTAPNNKRIMLVDVSDEGPSTSGQYTRTASTEWGELDTLEQLLSKGVFYKIKTWDLSKTNGVIDTVEFLWTSRGINVSETALASSASFLPLQGITHVYKDSMTTVGEKAIVFNQSLLTINNKRKIEYSGSDIRDFSKSSTRYFARYKFVLSNGGIVYSANNLPVDFQGLITIPSRDVSSVEIAITREKNIYDQDHVLEDVVVTYSFLKIPMRQHPNLPISFAYIGFENYFSEYAFATNGEISKEQLDRVVNFSAPERPYDEEDNKLTVSPSSNPFLVPEEKQMTFQSRIVGVAIATTALSQGQFGQFPIYVFTEDGIWAMETAADGSFITSKPLAREVCINPDSICSIDNAVVFVTDKAVMMIQGSQVMNISPYMNGRHYVPNASAVNLISHQDGFAEYAPVITDDDPFMKFMKDARTAYDYTGQRLIFISPSNTGFQYVYKIDTQTWHKMAFSGFDLEQQLNSYPECLVLGRQDKDQTYIEITTNQTHATEDEIIDFIKSFVNAPSDKISQFINGEWALNVTNLSEEELGRLTDMLDREYHILTTTFTDTKNVSVIYDLSTVLDASRIQQTAKGILITRPFDLGMPDVFKSITKIKIRGDYDKDNVKFILQGSDNGRDFYTLTSLRGKSWKMFRIFILADLEPTERISWIDIDFEPRYQNKLR